jgi:dihydroneopterin aldolase
LVNETVRIADAKPFKTLEALAEAVASGLLQGFEPVQQVTVAVSKLSPPIPQPVRAIAVEVRLTRAEYQTAG